VTSIFNPTSTRELYCILNRPKWPKNITFFVYIYILQDNVFCDKFKIIFCLGMRVRVRACMRRVCVCHFWYFITVLYHRNLEGL